MKIIYNKYIPFKGYDAISFYPFIFVNEGCRFFGTTGSLIDHEKIHLAQQKELYLIFFYLYYIIFYLYGLIKYRSHNKAYRNIPFEREAYENDWNEKYLKQRDKNAWTYYL